MWTFSATLLDFLFLTDFSGAHTTENCVTGFLRDVCFVRVRGMVSFRSLGSMSDEFPALSM